MKPPWFDGNLAKIFIGIAYYRCMYKLFDTICGKIGCGFIAGEGGEAGSCNNFPSVLSHHGINQLTKDESITPYFKNTATVKYFTYAGNSCVGYDDAETYALKDTFADDHCLGGIMIWSIEFDEKYGLELVDANEYKPPQSVTVVPIAHTRVSRS